MIAAEGEIRVRRRVHRLQFEVRGLLAASHHAGDEPETGLTVLPPPARPRSAPPVRLEPLVARDRGSRDGGERRHRRQHARREGLGLPCHPLGALPAVVQVPAAPVPEAEVDVHPVAHQPGEHHRRERRRQPVSTRDGADRVPDDEVRVRDRDARAMRHRQLELSGGVLGVELHHAGSLRLERSDQLGRERLDVGQDDRAVRGAGVRGDRVGIAAGVRERGGPGRTRPRTPRGAPARGSSSRSSIRRAKVLGHAA